MNSRVFISEARRRAQKLSVCDRFKFFAESSFFGVGVVFQCFRGCVVPVFVEILLMSPVITHVFAVERGRYVPPGRRSSVPLLCASGRRDCAPRFSARQNHLLPGCALNVASP